MYVAKLFWYPGFVKTEENHKILKVNIANFPAEIRNFTTRVEVRDVNAEVSVLGLFLHYYLYHNRRPHRHRHHRRRRRHQPRRRHHHHRNPAPRTITILPKNDYTPVYSFTFHFRWTFVQH